MYLSRRAGEMEPIPIGAYPYPVGVWIVFRHSVYSSQVETAQDKTRDGIERGGVSRIHKRQTGPRLTDLAGIHP
jgi:hypothetical protein